MEYPAETWTEEERAALAPHFTDLNGPVFALVNPVSYTHLRAHET